MKFEHFRQDARDFPATMTLSALWIVVFVAMLVRQATYGPGVSGKELILGLRGGHPFGEMTLNELVNGEVWRALTSTFVHYGLLHIGLNLYAFYQLGCLVESWYGAGQFVAIYALTGGVGNLLSGAVRLGLHYDRAIPSAGGSVVVMGLVGLCAVVGWRAGTRLGDYLRNQMVWVLALTAGIGLALPLVGLPIIDNWGHACGAIVGAAIGLANRKLVAQAGRSPAKWAGVAGSLLIAASAVAQVADNRKESIDQIKAVELARQQWVQAERRLLRLEELRQVYRAVAVPRIIPRGAVMREMPLKPGAAPKPGSAPPSPTGTETGDPEQEFYLAVVKASLGALESMREPLESGPTATSYQRLRTLIRNSEKEPLAFDELYAFDDNMALILNLTRIERDQARIKSLLGSAGMRVN